MNEFKKTLKKRLFGLLIIDIMIIIIVLLISQYGYQVMSDNKEFIQGFQTGVFVSIQMIFLSSMIRYIKVMRNKDQLKKLYIKENDERRRQINSKIGSFGFVFSIQTIALATIIAGFFNEIVFFTLLVVDVFHILVKLLLNLYFNKKYS